MAPQKIGETLEQIHPEPNTSNDFRALDSTLEAGGSNQPAEREKDLRDARSIQESKSNWFRCPRDKCADNFRVENTNEQDLLAVNSRQERANKIIPALLQDPSAEGGGIAHLEANMLLSEGEGTWTKDSPFSSREYPNNGLLSL